MNAVSTDSLEHEVDSTRGPQHGYVLVKGSAGLGNRLLTVLTGIAYAHLSGRVLVVDWSDPMFSDCGENSFPLLFECAVAHHVPRDIKEYSVEPGLWKGRLEKTPMQVVNEYYPKLLGTYRCCQRSSIDVSRVRYDARVVVLWGWDSQLYRFIRRLGGDLSEVAGMSERNGLRWLARRYLRPAMQIRERVAALNEGRKRPSIGVHIRYTDRKAPLHAIMARVDREYRRCPEMACFLATDSYDVEVMFRKRFPNVVTIGKGYMANGAPLHMGLHQSERAKRAVEAVSEMFALASCEQMIYASRSTFGVVADLLAVRGGEESIDVDRWNWALRGKRLLQRCATALRI